MNKPVNMWSPEQIEACLRELKLTTMADCFMDVFDSPEYENLLPLERFAVVLAREKDARAERRMQRCLQRSGLKALECFNQAAWDKVIVDAKRHLDEELLQRLLTNRWIENHNNVIISGPTGTGKTWVTALLGKSACYAGFTVKYMRMVEFVEGVSDAIDHKYLVQYTERILRHRIILLDDFASEGVLPVAIVNGVLHVFDTSQGRSSVIIASQKPFNEWHEYLGSGTGADAILDRLLNRSYRIVLRGDSLRERFSLAEE